MKAKLTIPGELPSMDEIIQNRINRKQFKEVES